MSADNHTPGEWAHIDTPAIRQLFHGCSVIASSERQDAILATIGEDVPEWRENAKLMAAASDMGKFLLRCYTHVAHGGPTRTELEEVLKKAGLL